MSGLIVLIPDHCLSIYFEKDLFILFTVPVFRQNFSTCACASIPFGFGCGIRDLVV